MSDIFCYAYVEDLPSKAVLERLIDYQNTNSPRGRFLHLKNGFPQPCGGFGPIKNKTSSFLHMAQHGIWNLVLTDLDQFECAPSLIQTWFGTENYPLSGTLFFRVVPHEIESWIIADLSALGKYLGIAQSNFSSVPETLSDPKQHLLNIIRQKGRKAWHKEMLPTNHTSQVGPLYNKKICGFIKDYWDPERAADHAPSLRKTLAALQRI